MAIAGRIHLIPVKRYVELLKVSLNISKAKALRLLKTELPRCDFAHASCDVGTRVHILILGRSHGPGAAEIRQRIVSSLPVDPVA
jgi:hypothetical protein